MPTAGWHFLTVWHWWSLPGAALYSEHLCTQVMITSLSEGRVGESRSNLWGPATFEKASHKMRILSRWWKLKFAEHKRMLCLNRVGNVQTKEDISPGVYNMFQRRHIDLWWLDLFLSLGLILAKFFKISLISGNSAHGFFMICADLKKKKYFLNSWE